MRHIDLSKDFDAVQVKWVGSTSTGMVGTIEIKKSAIKDKSLLEWMENRELYEIWEE